MANSTQFETNRGESPALPLILGGNGTGTGRAKLAPAETGAEISSPTYRASPAVAVLSPASPPGGDAGAGIAAEHAEETFVFPASREQTRYWMLAQLDPESTASNMAIAFEIEGSASDTLVEQSIAALTLRHEALRTVFRLENGLLSQVVLSRPLYRFTVEDLGAVPAPEQGARLEASVSRHGHTVVNLQDGPVLHARLIHLNAGHHVIALTMNHIVCDGWSNGILIRDFTLIYEALLAGNDPVLPELPFQFADFSLWQNEYLASPAADEAAAFWKAHITSDMSALDMPTDHSRPSGRSFPGHIESALLPREIDEQLKAYCRKTGSTKHIVLLAAFEALCATYTGQKQFLLGSTIANRTQPGMEDVVGRFANPQIIVAKVEGDPNFTQLEQRVRDWETAAYLHQDLPFSRVIEDFQIDQAGATSQFLQVWFLYQKAFMQPQTGKTIRVTPRRSVSGGVDFDLLVSVVERAEGPRIQFEYNTLIFEPARIRGLIASFIQLLGGALEQPSLPLSELTRMAAKPASAVAASAPAFETPSSQMPSSQTVQETGSFLTLFARHAAARPDSVAVTDSTASFTWQEVDRLSSALAADLLNRQLELTSVAIVLAPAVDSFVALLAAIKTGSKIAPLPAQTSASAASRYAEHLGAVMLAPRALLTCDGIAFEDFANLPASSDSWIAPARSGNFLFLTDTANATFAETTRAALFASVTAAIGQLGWNDGSSILCLPSPTPHDACLDLLAALISGAQWNFADVSGQIAETIALHDVSCVVASPSQAKKIVISGWPGDRRVTLVLRGERLPANMQAMLNIRLKSAVSLLATPQTGGYTAIQQLGGERMQPGMRSLGASSLVLMNAEGAIVPAGAFGEICLEDGTRTGMMARSSSTGVIEPVDWASRFVQLRGHRVCLGDIEDAAFALPFIHGASVIFTDAEDDDRLLLYVASDAPDTAGLQHHLANTLPSHLMPSDIVWIDNLRLLADGSLDRNALPQREQTVPPSADDEPAVPYGDVEPKLAAIWKDVLGVKTIDIHKSFFALGGSSLLLVRLFARINKAFGTSLPITTIFDAQSVARLAIVLGGDSQMSHLVQVQTGGSKQPLFMIHSYLLYQGLSQTLGPDQPFYGLRELEQDGQLNIEERVKRYVAEIRQVQPHGPYHLAGWCAAGPLTGEVARQLLASGEQVQYLALFDSWLPGYIESLETGNRKDSWLQSSSVRNKVTYHRNKLRPLSWSKRVMYAWMIITRLSKETRYRVYLNNWERIYRLSVKYNFSLPQFMHNTSFQTFSALKEYHGQRVPLRLTLIRASDAREVTGAVASCGWEQIAEQGVDVVWAPGDHETMFIGDHLKATSKIVQQGLAAAQLGGAPFSGLNADGTTQTQVRGMMHVDCPST